MPPDRDQSSTASTPAAREAAVLIRGGAVLPMAGDSAQRTRLIPRGSVLMVGDDRASVLARVDRTFELEQAGRLAYNRRMARLGIADLGDTSPLLN